MTQNLIDLSFTEEQLRAIDGAIATLEANLTGLIALSAAQRLSLQKMGAAGEPFCRSTVSLLAHNPQIVPPTLGVVDAQADLLALDQLRPRAIRLKTLVGRVEDSEMALGSDVFAVARVGYKLIGAVGGDQGLKGARRELEPRYTGRSAAATARRQRAEPCGHRPPARSRCCRARSMGFAPHTPPDPGCFSAFEVEVSAFFALSTNL